MAGIWKSGRFVMVNTETVLVASDRTEVPPKILDGLVIKKHTGFCLLSFQKASMKKSSTTILQRLAKIHGHCFDRPQFKQCQEDAQKNKRGLWAEEDPVAPWDWRRR